MKLFKLYIHYGKNVFFFHFQTFQDNFYFPGIQIIKLTGNILLIKFAITTVILLSFSWCLSSGKIIFNIIDWDPFFFSFFGDDHYL